MGTRISDEALLALAAVAASIFAADAYLIRQLRILHHDTVQLDQYVSVSVGRIRHHDAVVNDANREGIEALAEALARDRRATEAAAGDARTAAQRYAADLAGNVVRAGRNQMAGISQELNGVQAKALAISESARSLTHQLADARSETRSAQAGNDRATTTTTGLRAHADALASEVSRQRDELAAQVHASGHDQFEFHLTKSSQPYGFRGFTFRLCKADPKHGRYSLDIVAGDRRIHAADRTVDEPVRLVSPGGRVIEVVVREIRPNEVRGSVAASRRQVAASYYSRGKAETESFPLR